MERIVLAYSGGLDTTVIIPWLRENYGDCEIIAVCVNVGQCGDDDDVLKERAIETGANKVVIIDAQEEFISEYLFSMLKCHAVYESRYLLGTSVARPLIAKKLIDVALAENATAICHGATGKGNDQIRFELTFKTFVPNLKIIAPWRIWDIKSRDDAMEFLKKRGLTVPMKKEQSYSRDQNSWHLSHEGLELESPEIEPDYNTILQLSVSPENAPDKAEYVELSFEKGVPVKLNGEKLPPIELLNQLNIIGGRNGIGIVDIVENRVVGMKSRGIYETPGGTILYAAHQQLEQLCLDRKTMDFKDTVAQKMAEIIYIGEWYTPLRRALSAFVDITQETVTGTVKLKLYKGNIIPAGSSSPYSLYSENLASFTTGDLYDHKDAEGFINLLGLPMQVRALMKLNLEEKEKL